jgi:hypothetical protein
MAYTRRSFLFPVTSQRLCSSKSPRIQLEVLAGLAKLVALCALGVRSPFGATNFDQKIRGH